MHPGTPGQAVALRVSSPLLKARGLRSALVSWMFLRVFPQFSAPGRAHPVPSALGTGCRAHEGVRMRGSSSSSPLSARSKYRGVCSVPTLAGLTCMDRLSSCVCSPARGCYLLASLIFLNLYICFYKFSRKLRSNLFHPVIPLQLPPVHFIILFFFFLAGTSCIM